MSMDEPVSKESHVQLEVVRLAEQLGLEVLHGSTKADNRKDIHTHCAEYLAVRMKNRAVSERMAAAANAWSDDKKVMKQRQAAFMTSPKLDRMSCSNVDIKSASDSKLNVALNALGPTRCKSAQCPSSLVVNDICHSIDSENVSKDKPLPMHNDNICHSIDSENVSKDKPLPMHSYNMCHSIDSEKVSKDKPLPMHSYNMGRSIDSENVSKDKPSPMHSDNYGNTSSITFNQSALVPGNNHDGKTDSEFSTSIDFIRANEKFENATDIHSPSSTSIEEHQLSEDECRSSSCSLQIAKESEEKEELPDELEHQVEEDDLCTFAFFKSTTEHRKCENSENGTTHSTSARISSSSGKIHGQKYKSHIYTLVGHESMVTQCHFTNQFVATSSRDGTLRIWSLTTGKPIRILNCRRPIHDFQFVNFRTKLPYLILGCEDGAIILIRLQEDKETGALRLSLGGEYTGHLPNPIRTMAISPTRLDLATGCCFMMNQISIKGRAILTCRGTLKTWNLDSMLRAAEEGKTYDGLPSGIRTMHQIVSRAPRIHISRRLKYGEQPNYGLRSLAYSPDGRLLVVGLGHPNDTDIVDQHLLVVLQSDTMATIWMEDTHLCQVTRLDLVPQLPRRMHCGGAFLLVLSTFNRAALVNCRQDDDKGLSVEYVWVNKFDEPHFGTGTSPNGLLVASCVGRAVLICACATGETLLRIDNAHDGWVRSLCFSPDSRQVVTVSADGTAKVWSVPETEYLLPPEVYPEKSKQNPYPTSGVPSTPASICGSTSEKDV